MYDVTTVLYLLLEGLVVHLSTPRNHFITHSMQFLGKIGRLASEYVIVQLIMQNVYICSDIRRSSVPTNVRSFAICH